MRLYLVRHGQTAWNEARRAQGHTDIPLDEAGQSQAQALGEAFRSVPLTRVYTSDLSRAKMTAEAVVATTGADLEVRRDLRERGFGDLEGQPFTAVHDWLEQTARERDEHLLRVRPPAGESYEDVWNRLGRIVEEIDQTEGAIAVVSHGGTSSLLLARLLRGNLETSRGFRLNNTGVTELERRTDGYYVMLRYNDVSHTVDLGPLVSGLDAASR